MKFKKGDWVRFTEDHIRSYPRLAGFYFQIESVLIKEAIISAYDAKRFIISHPYWDQQYDAVTMTDECFKRWIKVSNLISKIKTTSTLESERINKVIYSDVIILDLDFTIAKVLNEVLNEAEKII